MEKKVLAFGYIPKSKGGKQTTGLATGIFDLHNTVNVFQSSYRIIIAATDIQNEQIQIEETNVIGWNSKKLLSYLLLRPHKFLFFLFKTVSYFRFKKIISPFSLFFKFVFLDYAINKTKPDAVHFHGTTGALVSTGLFKKNKKILRIHGINGKDQSIPNNEIHFLLEKYVGKLHFDSVSFVTEGILSEWSDLYGKFNCKMWSILNGYNDKLFKPGDKSIPILYDLVTFSGISPRKGQDRIIDALIRLKKSGINLSYLVIGSGDENYLKKIKLKASEYKLEVQFIDYISQEEIVEYLHQSKFFILPSITEGFGKVFIESIGAGVPVIIPSHLPLVKEGNILKENNSIIIEDYSTESIEKGLREIVENKSVFNAEEVANSVKHLSWEESAKQYLDIYNSLFVQNGV